MADNTDATSTDTNADGKGGGSQGSGIQILIGVVIAAIGAAIVEIGKSLFGVRSVVISVGNQTPIQLTRLTDHHESGGFQKNPGSQIGPMGNDVFSSQSTNGAEGTIGSVTYTGPGITILVGWNNPRVGSNNTNTTLIGPASSRYLLVRQTGSGNENAQMVYALGIHPTYQVRASLAARGHGDLTHGLAGVGSALGHPSRPISLRDLVAF